MENVSINVNLSHPTIKNDSDDYDGNHAGDDGDRDDDRSDDNSDDDDSDDGDSV